MFEPAKTGLGVPTLVMERFAVLAAPTIVRTVAVLFARTGSLVPEVAPSVSVICVPVAVPAFTLTATVNVAAPFAPEPTSGFVHWILPVPFTAGVVQVQPAAPKPDVARD